MKVFDDPLPPLAVMPTMTLLRLEFLEDDHVELYNLHDDLSKRHDLAREMPDRAVELRHRLHTWRDAVGEALPTPNPDLQGSKSKARVAQVAS